MLEDVAPGRAAFLDGHVTVPEQEAVSSPVSEPYVPAGQNVHDVEPANEYEPVAQIPQTVESLTVLEVAPARALLPAGHETVPVQVATWRPVVEPYVPAGQDVHVAEPANEYVPVEQAPVH